MNPHTESDTTPTLRCTEFSPFNPLTFFAALGALDVITAHAEGTSLPTLRWATDAFEPYAVLSGIDTADDFAHMVLRDRDAWLDSVVLHGPTTQPAKDLKVDPDAAREWLALVEADGTARELRLLQALLSEGGLDASSGSKTKPTHLHFTAGNQQFLVMIRDLASQVTAERVIEAVVGPWAYDCTSTPMGWDTSVGERLYALRATAPASDKKLSVPAADWLAFLGLAYFPTVTSVDRRLHTTGCEPGWKRGSLTWPVWDGEVTATTARSLIAGPLAHNFGRFADTAEARARRGIRQVMRSRIIRADQGGYGSFAPPEPILPSERSTGTKARSRSQKAVRS